MGVPLDRAFDLRHERGSLDEEVTRLHDIWGMSNVTAMAFLSLTVVIAFALFMAAVSIRVFTRSAVH